MPIGLERKRKIILIVFDGISENPRINIINIKRNKMNKTSFSLFLVFFFMTTIGGYASIQVAKIFKKIIKFL